MNVLWMYYSCGVIVNGVHMSPQSSVFSKLLCEERLKKAGDESERKGGGEVVMEYM